MKRGLLRRYIAIDMKRALMEDHSIDSGCLSGHGDRVAGDQDMAALGLEFLLLCDIQYAVLADPDLHYICIRTLLL